MATLGKTRILLTGPPGVGKTTVIKRVCDVLRNEHKIGLSGFYTEEIRDGRQRQGFDVVTFDGQKGPLARKSDLLSVDMKKTSPAVGQYSVDLSSFEKIALPTLKDQETSVLIIDEIGKMELFSEQFSSTVRRLFNESKIVIVATIPLQKGKLFNVVEEVRSRSDVQLITVSRENRDELVNEIVKIVMSQL